MVKRGGWRSSRCLDKYLEKLLKDLLHRDGWVYTTCFIYLRGTINPKP